MADIKSLLNPLPDQPVPRRYVPTGLNLRTYTRELSPPPTPRKKPKLSKDAAVFIRGDIRGTLNYPPYEDRDGLLLAQHQQHEVYPMGNIAEFPRHIPYNSEKKSFLEKTGRESFEVFQYEFKLPGEEKVYCMMWDYNIGLVRTTALFKCTGYSKTTPAKMLNRNPGLRDICHSITGGALVAQGYWMPFEAARAVAATFCWRIRYALTPVFGPDFPSMCTPTDSEKFGEMIIDPAITRYCTQKAKEYKAMEGTLSSRASSVIPTPVTPESPSFARLSKHLQSAGGKVAQSSSGYGTDSNNDKNYGLSSLATYNGVWTPANTPRSVSSFDQQHTLPSPQVIGIAETGNNVLHDEELRSDRLSSPSSTGTGHQVRKRYSSDEYYDGDDSGVSTSTEDTNEEAFRAQGSTAVLRDGLSSADEKAAYLLIGLRMADTNLNDNSGCMTVMQEFRGRKRRASA